MRPVTNSAILRSKKLIKCLDAYFEGKKFSQTKIPFTSVAVDLLSGKVYSFKGEDDLSEGVAASASIPAVFKPIKKDQMTLVDGGVLCRLPLQEVRDMGAEVIVAVDALGKTRQVDRNFNIVTVIMRAYEIMDGVLTNNKNQMLCPDLLVEPELGDMSQFKFKDFDMAIQAGYNAGIQNIEKIKELIK